MGGSEIEIQRRREMRLAFLRAVYEACGGTMLGMADADAIGRSIGLSSDDSMRCEMDLRGRGYFEGAGGTHIRLTGAGLQAAEAASLSAESLAPTTPPSIYVHTMIDSAIQQGVSGSDQSVSSDQATRSTGADHAGDTALEAVNSTVDGHPLHGPVTYGMRVRNRSSVRVSDVLIWLVERREDRFPEDTPHATDQHFIRALPATGEWVPFRLTQTGPFKSPHVFRDAVIVGSWSDPSGVSRGEIGSTHVF